MAKSVHKFPRIIEKGRKPDKERDGEENYGKPCAVCETGTVGFQWVQVNWFRGDDEKVPICTTCWKLPKTEILTAWESSI